MFSGIVSSIGTIKHAEIIESARRFIIACDYDPADLSLGASVACSGICLTVTDINAEKQVSFSVDVSQETLSLTPAAFWQTGDTINLELSLKLGDSIDGHFVFGHIDGLAEITAINAFGDMQEMILSADKDLMRLIAKKGSVAIDGVSLTVNKVGTDNFHLMIIPYTLQNTTLQNRKVGDKCAIEIDMLMRYVARLQETPHD